MQNACAEDVVELAGVRRIEAEQILLFDANALIQHRAQVEPAAQNPQVAQRRDDTLYRLPSAAAGNQYAKHASLPIAPAAKGEVIDLHGRTQVKEHAEALCKALVCRLLAECGERVRPGPIEIRGRSADLRVVERLG
eukprot:7390636-Prymnesium_polylepis.2